MTHSYRIELRVEDFDPKKQKKIAKALKGEWGWDKTYTIVSDDEIYLSGDDNLSGSFEDFFTELKEAVYKAHGGCCTVNIDIYDLESPPTDSFGVSKEECEAETGAVADKTDSATGFEHLSAPNDVLDVSFEGWGYREMGIAAQLLDKYSDDPSVLPGGDIHVGFNTQSGNVFLYNEDSGTAMMNGNKIERFYSCPECGHEGFLSEMAHDPEGQDCVRYMEEIGVDPAKIKKYSDDEDEEEDELGFEHLGAARTLPTSAECQTCGATIKPRWSKSEQAMSLRSGIRQHYWDEHRRRMLKGVKSRYAAAGAFLPRCFVCLGKLDRGERAYVQCERCGTRFHPGCARRVGKCPKCGDDIGALPTRYFGGSGPDMNGFEHLGSGNSFDTDCPRCGSPSALVMYTDTKPIDTVDANCLGCGFRVYTVLTIMPESDRQTRCEDMEIKCQKVIQNKRTKDFDEIWGVEPDEKEGVQDTGFEHLGSPFGERSSSEGVVGGGRRQPSAPYQWWERGEGKVKVECPICHHEAWVRAGWRNFTCFQCNTVLSKTPGGTVIYSAPSIDCICKNPYYPEMLKKARGGVDG